MRLFLLLFVTLLGPLAASHSFEPGDLPPVPDSGIYDPDQWLTDRARSDMERSIATTKLKWATRVFLVVLPERPNAEGEILAQRIAEGWGAGKLWGIAIHVVGDPDFPAFYTGRKVSFGWGDLHESEFTRDLKVALEDVRGRAMREGDRRAQVQTGVRELCDELGYLGIVRARIDRRYDKSRGEGLKVHRKKQSDFQFLKRLLMVLVPLVLLLVVMAIFLIRKKRKRKRVRSDFYFPETSPRRRFLAPWSGGGDVIVKFGSRIKEDGSRKG